MADSAEVRSIGEMGCPRFDSGGTYNDGKLWSMRTVVVHPNWATFMSRWFGQLSKVPCYRRAAGICFGRKADAEYVGGGFYGGGSRPSR